MSINHERIFHKNEIFLDTFADFVEFLDTKELHGRANANKYQKLQA